MFSSPIRRLKRPDLFRDFVDEAREQISMRPRSRRQHETIHLNNRSRFHRNRFAVPRRLEQNERRRHLAFLQIVPEKRLQPFVDDKIRRRSIAFGKGRPRLRSILPTRRRHNAHAGLPGGNPNRRATSTALRDVVAGLCAHACGGRDFNGRASNFKRRGFVDEARADDGRSADDDGRAIAASGFVDEESKAAHGPCFAERAHGKTQSANAYEESGEKEREKSAQMRTGKRLATSIAGRFALESSV